MTISKKMFLAAIALAVSAPAYAPAFASGGYGGGGGGASSGTFNRVQRDPAQEAYRKGKSYFKRYVTCKKCSYSTGVNDSPTARKVMQQVRNGDIAVKEKHKQQLLYYISRRYRVQA